MVIKYWEILSEEHCKKLFSSVNSFWVEIGGKGVNINWLVKFSGHLDKVEKEQTKNKQKKVSSSITLSDNFYLKINFFHSFSLKQVFYEIAILNASSLKIYSAVFNCSITGSKNIGFHVNYSNFLSSMSF